MANSQFPTFSLIRSLFFLAFLSCNSLHTCAAETSGTQEALFPRNIKSSLYHTSFIFLINLRHSKKQANQATINPQTQITASPHKTPANPNNKSPTERNNSPPKLAQFAKDATYSKSSFTVNRQYSKSLTFLFSSANSLSNSLTRSFHAITANSETSPLSLTSRYSSLCRATSFSLILCKRIKPLYSYLFLKKENYSSGSTANAFSVASAPNLIYPACTAAEECPTISCTIAGTTPASCNIVATV